jgi:hypothetical protein
MGVKKAEWTGTNERDEGKSGGADGAPCVSETRQEGVVQRYVTA